jgi:hypothetical protein
VTDVRSTEADRFGFFPDMIVRKVATRVEAIDALTAIGEQGEGSATPSAGEHITAPVSRSAP